MRALQTQGSDRQTQPLQVLVLAGGDSEEREISLQSGAAVAQSLREAGHQVRLRDPLQSSLQNLISPGEVVVPMLHGRGGEDGSLQRRLQQLGVPWLGCSAEAAALTFSKVRTRERLQQAGLPVANGVCLREGEDTGTADQLRWPLVVKPAEQGSSIGVSIVGTTAELPAALKLAWQFGCDAVVEEYIAGREITVAMADELLLAPVEIEAADGWYDFHAKYVSDRTRYIVNPGQLPEGLHEIVREACRVCQVTGLSRTDLRLMPDGRIALLEINTIPGMTSHSLVPMAAAAMGLSIAELLEPMLLKCCSPCRLAG